MPAAGVDISDRSLKIVELVQEEGRLELGRFARKILPEGVIQSGEIKNKKALSDLLRTAFEEFKGLGSVMLALPEEKAFVSMVTLPKMDEADLREALEVQLEEHVPLPTSQAVFDYEVIRKGVPPDHLDAVVVAFPRMLVEAYRDAVREAGLIPLVFEMEAHALVRAVLPKDETEPAMVIDFGRTRTSFIIVSDGAVRFTSTVSVAGEALDKALAKIFNVDVFEAERLKKERGLVRTRENQEVFNALLPIVSAIRDEISRHLTFWGSHAEHLHRPDPEVRKIYLCGGDANFL